jgi:TonB dependent receptor-like, beta-barrel/Carboxypeptidase regulatory-like domain
MRFTLIGRALGALALFTVWLAAPAGAQQAQGPTGTPASTAPTIPAADTAAAADLYGTVTDSGSGDPLAGAEIQVLRRGEIIAQAETDRLGTYRIHQVRAGSYAVQARLVGYRPADTTLVIGSGGDLVEVSFHMRSAPIQLSAIQVSATPVAVDTRTGNQVYNENQAQASPALTTSAIVQQAIAGAARAPTGEVHIRGQHAEYTYYVDGVPVPPGVSGSLNELFDPSVAQQITFQTGSWDAEYGGRNAAIINVQTRIPSGGFHADVSSYAGNYGADGQTLTASTNAGALGLFVSGTRTETTMRREPVVSDTTGTGQLTGVRNYDNYGQDQYVFGKLQFTPTANDVMSLDANWSQTHFQTPFDSAAGVIHDWERDRNDFVNVAWQHSAPRGPNAGTELFGAVFYRHGSLAYAPGVNDQPSFTFAPDTTPYNVSEARTFDIYGLKADYTLRLSEALVFKLGTLSSITRGHENFQAFTAANPNGPTSDSPLTGSDIGGYAQSVIQPVDQWQLRVGIRYDSHYYPTSATAHATASQVSPRIRLSWFPSPQTSAWVYYGRQFIPTNIEDLRAITSASQGGVVSAPTLPERDDFYEVGLTHRFPAGVVVKLSGYHKKSSPGTDDTQVPGTAITTDVNIAQVRVTGIESVVEVRPGGPLSGFLNVALAHAYGFGAVTGGFFTTTPPAQPFDLDHDQRLSATAGLTFSAKGWLLDATGIYGSGLTNGVTPNAPGRPLYDSTIAATPALNTGLLDFNSAFKVKPSFIVDASAGYTFLVGNVEVRPQLFVDNLFNLHYTLKGAFFSGASFGRPRTVQFKVNLGV